MERWGVKHLFVWTDESRNYLAKDRRFVERWRGGRWSHFERPDADARLVVTGTGSGISATSTSSGPTSSS